MLSKFIGCEGSWRVKLAAWQRIVRHYTNQHALSRLCFVVTAFPLLFLLTRDSSLGSDSRHWRCVAHGWIVGARNQPCLLLQLCNNEEVSWMKYNVLVAVTMKPCSLGEPWGPLEMYQSCRFCCLIAADHDHCYHYQSKAGNPSETSVCF